MCEKQKPKIGQVLYSLNVGNAARHTEQILQPVIVVTVGRIYFEVAKEGYEKHKHMRTQYYLENWQQKTNYSANSKLYQSEKEWEDKKLSSELFKKIQDAFSYGKAKRIPLYKLEKIDAIMCGGD